MRYAMQIALALAVGLLALDLLGFVFWIESGHAPVDNWYLGTITAHALGAIAN